MAKTKTKDRDFQYPKPKTSIFLCCVGYLPKKHTSMASTIKGSDPIPKQKRTSWFSWRTIRMKKNSAAKTVPLESSVSDQKQKLQSKRKANKAHYSSNRSRSKSTFHRSQAPATNPPPPSQTLPVHPVTPYYTPSQTRHGANHADDTRQKSRASPPHAKRQVQRPSSSVQSQTLSKNARSSYDTVVGMSVVMVTLVIMIFWGRLCAILCTSAWLYFIPRFRTKVNVNDQNDNNSKDLDLDSEVHKKRVIMEGLLERNHHGTL